MRESKGWTESLLPWLLASSGVIYTAGFLVVSASLNRFGIRNIGGDLFKARYIPIGILCFSFPFIFHSVVFSIINLIYYAKVNKERMWQRLLPVGLLFINLLIVCFIMVTCVNRIPGSNNIAGFNAMLWIIAATLIGMPLLLLIERIIERVTCKASASDRELPPVTQSFTVNGRWVLVLIVTCLDTWFFLDIKILRLSLVLVYVVFSIFLSVFIIVVLQENRRSKGNKRTALSLLSACMIGPYAYMVVFAFSYGVFQNIPATKGGGDYTASPKVIVTLREKPAISEMDAKYFNDDNPQITVPLVLIEETELAYYLADPQDGGGPEEWKMLGGCKPEIFIVNKSDVVKVQTESRKPKRI